MPNLTPFRLLSFTLAVALMGWLGAGCTVDRVCTLAGCGSVSTSADVDLADTENTDLQCQTCLDNDCSVGLLRPTELGGPGYMNADMEGSSPLKCSAHLVDGMWQVSATLSEEELSDDGDVSLVVVDLLTGTTVVNQQQRLTVEESYFPNGESCGPSCGRGVFSTP